MVEAILDCFFMCRVVLMCHVVSLVLELGVLTVMFMSVASNARKPQGVQRSNSGEQVALMVVSLCTTLATFTLTMIGAGSALAGLRVVSIRISARVSAAGARMLCTRAATVEAVAVPMEINSTTTTTAMEDAGVEG